MTVAFQRKGLFSFEHSVYSMTEKNKFVMIRVMRFQGTEGIVSIPFTLIETTATNQNDFKILINTDGSKEDLNIGGTLNGNGYFVLFNAGQKTKTIRIEILDDNLLESHFEVFKLVLNDPNMIDASLGTTIETQVRIYDYGEGVPLTEAIFPSQTTDRKNLLGWQIVSIHTIHRLQYSIPIL
jgi:hypothetical protein